MRGDPQTLSHHPGPRSAPKVSLREDPPISINVPRGDSGSEPGDIISERGCPRSVRTDAPYFEIFIYMMI